MLEKEFIAKKLENFFKFSEADNFMQVIITSFLYDKIIYINEIIDEDSVLGMLDKYVYNLENNLRKISKLKNYHSIYAHYDYKNKQLNYYMAVEYSKTKMTNLNKHQKKDFLVQEFKLMIYKELEKIINIYSANGKIVSNYFYINDSFGRYPEYEDNYSDIADAFADVEVCELSNINEKLKVFVDAEKNFFVYSNHVSLMNSEIFSYVKLWKRYIGRKILYFAINNPKKYSEQMINDFNRKYSYVLNADYKFLLTSNDIFSLIENYLLHIRGRIDVENNLRYHQDLSAIFELMQKESNVPKYKSYLLQSKSK